MVFLEGAWGVRLEYCEFHGPFLILTNLVISGGHMVLFFRGVHYLQFQAEFGL
jgi:hypothetical protein